MSAIVITELSRDLHRIERRAGPTLAQNRVSSLCNWAAIGQPFFMRLAPHCIELIIWP